MNRIAVLSLAVLLSACAGPSIDASADPDWRSTYAELLGRYVTASGVEYEEWHAAPADVAALEGVVAGIAGEDVDTLEGDAKLAFYINAYNAWMLDQVLQAYPVANVTEVAPLWGVFTNRRIIVAGEAMSLNHLEKQIILKQFSDPRVHFAINCASRSCPPLLNTPYTGGQLDAQLDAVTKNAVSNNPLIVEVVGNTVEVFEVFKWYAADFEKAGGTKAFIEKYRDEPLPEGAEIAYQDYDWSLNQAE